MVLKELEIQGFKSFPDKIKISIGSGITGVVGPNGSGKSNISDAIRWVLGETSSKQLRGAGKMEDVIFGGTQLRGAMGFASVRLTLDNSDHALELDADEVVIGRKYYRSGDSEYSINGQNCRLKDVYELFLDTGLGRDGYSIIGQGRIAEIVGAKSNERREIFEEASGIAKFRYRKNEAERRLASAEENLERLRDILAELESRVGPLEKESAKAEKFLELSAQRKSLEVTLWVDSVRRAKETVRTQQRLYETAEADYTRLDTECSDAEAEAEEIRTASQRLTLEIDRLNADIRAITEEMSGTESRIAVLNHDIQRNDQSISELEEEIIRGEETREGIAAEIDEREAAIGDIAAQCAAIDAEAQSLEQLLAKIQSDSLASGERRGAVTAKLAELTKQQTESRVASASARSAAETAAQRLAAAESESVDARTRRDALREEQADTTVYLEKLDETLAKLANIKSGLALKLQGRRRALDEADAAEQRLDRELEGCEQKLSIQRDLEKNMDGYNRSVKAVMQAARSGRLRGVIGPVSGVVRVEKGYETAIEIALGAAVQNLLVEHRGVAHACMDFLKSENAGRATFLPLDTVQPREFHGELRGSERVAADVVSCDARYRRVVQNLLGNVILAENKNEASATAERLGYRNRVVTLDGQVVNAGGSYTGGSVSQQASLLNRRGIIEGLQAQIKALQKKQSEAQEATDARKAEVDAAAADLTATESEEITAKGDRIRAETEAGRIATALSQAEAAVQLHEAELEQLHTQIAAGRTSADTAAGEDARLAAEIETLSGELSRLSEGDDSFLETRTRLSDQLAQKRLDRLAKEKDAELHRSAIAALRSRTGESAQRKAEVEKNITALQTLNEENRAKIAEIETERGSAAQRIAEKEQAIRDAAAERLAKQQAETEAAARGRAAADQREKMSQEMARLAERRTAAEAEYDQTIAKLWEEYQLSVSEGEKLCVEFENVTALRTQVAELRGKIRALGNVNVSAIEEYKEVRERYDTLSGRVADVEKSKAELTRMITELCGQMREIFADNFKTINENFGRIFRELFGGGTAELYLDADADVLDAGIEIRVQPPGKVIKNLTALSGGEQALVATSIYFAILAVNPAPFCILDEIEAALDDANVVRYAQYLRRISDKTQFIVITHRRGTMEAADVLYGVTMQDDGVSKLLRLDLENVDATLVN